MSDKITNILIVGVGGQGIILAGEIMAKVALNAGFDVKKSEIHGMAQRGGSVNSQVRFGAKVNSPVIPEGETDILLSFEKLEPLRWIAFNNKDTKAIINDQIIHSMTTATGVQKYPDNVDEELKNLFSSLKIVKAIDEAKKLGNVKVVNILLLGLVARILPFEKQAWLDALEQRLPKKVLEVNLKAFERGYELGQA